MFIYLDFYTTNDLTIRVTVYEPTPETPSLVVSQKRNTENDSLNLYTLDNASQKSIQTYRNEVNSLFVVAGHHTLSVTLVADYTLFGGEISNPDEPYFLGELSYTWGDRLGEISHGRASVRCEFGI